jgi:hypothetical protein
MHLFKQHEGRPGVEQNACLYRLHTALMLNFTQKEENHLSLASGE